MSEIDRRQLLVSAGAIVTAHSLFHVAAASSGRDQQTHGKSTDKRVPQFLVTRLRAEGIDRPIGLEARQPRFSWAVESESRNVRQFAYRLTMASSPEILASGAADVWDSGCVESSCCFDIRYGGYPLHSRQRVWWRVQVWHRPGQEFSVSEIAWFEMGLLAAADWSAEWLVIASLDEEQDRQAGIHWIWGEERLDTRPQKFRAVYRLRADGVNEDSQEKEPLNGAPVRAQLFLSAKDELLGVWVNGDAISTPPSVSWGTMLPLVLTLFRGRNVICIEARTTTTEEKVGPDGGALAALLKVDDPHFGVSRYTTGSAWRTSNADSPGWTDPNYDDEGWNRALNSTVKMPFEPWTPRPAMHARREFSIKKPLARARLYATALGAYEAYINTQRVGDAHLAPEITVASDHVLYQCYDATAMLTAGANVIGALIGDGWYAAAFGWRDERYALGNGPRRFLAQLVLEYADGSLETVSTDEQWRIAESAIRICEIYNGESYDARLESPGWNRAGFDDRDWALAKIHNAPDVRLVAQVGPTIREAQTLPVWKITEPTPGVIVCDFGQNFAGWCRLRVKGPAGRTVRLRHAELLKASGEVDATSLGGALATDTYTLRGDPQGELYEPRFTYHGFRYVEISGLPEPPAADSITGVVAHSHLAETGIFETSHNLVRSLWRNALWSQRSNFFGVPTDCPQRDERMGWMGDIQVFADAAAFNMDIDAFLRRFMIEVRAGQTPDGAFPIVTPQPRSFNNLVTPGWSDAGVILPWTLYQRYGATGVIEENWSAMERWLTYIFEVNPDFIWRKRRSFDLGDWLSVDAKSSNDETTPYELIATAYWAYCSTLMTDMAQAIGHVSDAERYAEMRRNIASAFTTQFVNSDGTVGNGSQTSYALALRFDLVPGNLREAAGYHLASDISRRGMRLSTGFLGTPYILDVLADTGHTDVAVSLLLQTKYPSWGYMVDKGATTMWERWDADVDNGGDRSQNHYAFGAIAGFMYRRLAGITPAAPGFRRIDINPIFDPRINWVKASYDSCLGRISTEVSGDQHGLFQLAIEIPPNSVAHVHLPQRSGSWRETRTSIEGCTDMRILKRSAAGLIVEVGSGRYLFSAS